MMRSRKAIFAALLLAAAARAVPAEGSAEELDLFAKSLRPQGRAELEGNAAPLAPLPAELQPGASAVLSMTFRGQLRQLREGEDDPLVAATGVLAQLAPGLAPLSGRQRTEKGYGTFAVGAHGATLVDWYPQ